MKKVYLIFWTAFLFLSCEKEKEDVLVKESFQETTNPDNVDNAPISNDKDDDNYFVTSYWGFGELSTEAGIRKVGIDYNDKWTTTYNGNISGFEYSPTEGFGKGEVTIKYDDVKYTISHGYIEWSESGHLLFHVREGTKKDWVRKDIDIYLYRHGSRIHL